MKILLLDNYDSFTYNLAQSLRQVGKTQVEVVRNDRIRPEEMGDFDKIMLSPGPGLPAEAGVLMDTIRYWAGRKSILGICLGHQAIGEVFGGSLLNLDSVCHGIASDMEVAREDLLFRDLPQRFEAGRYHSWVLDPSTFPQSLEIICLGPAGEIMGLRHREFDLRGLQFHPESILTPLGLNILKNWAEA